MNNPDTKTENVLNPPPATEQQHRLADAMDASLNEVREAQARDSEEHAKEFMDQYRARLAKLEQIGQMREQMRTIREEQKTIGFDSKIDDEMEAHAKEFLDRYRAKAGHAIANAAFHEFFELASKLNESAHRIGIRHVTLDADKGDVSVVYRSREAS